MQVKQKRVPDSNHLLGQRRHFVGSFVGPTSTNDVSRMSICLSCRRNCLNLTLKQLLLSSKILKHVHIRILNSHQNSFGGNPGYIISYHCPLIGVIDDQIRDGPSDKIAITEALCHINCGTTKIYPCYRAFGFDMQNLNLVVLNEFLNWVFRY